MARLFLLRIFTSGSTSEEEDDEAEGEEEEDDEDSSSLGWRFLLPEPDASSPSLWILLFPLREACFSFALSWNRFQGQWEKRSEKYQIELYRVNNIEFWII